MRRRTVLASAGKTLLLLLLLTGAALPAVFMNSVYGYLPVLTLLILLILSGICLLVLRRRMDVEIEDGRETVQCVRGGSVDVGMRVRNRSMLACPKAVANVFISDLFGGSDSLKTVLFSIGSRETVPFAFDMDMTHIGMYTIGFQTVELYDFFGAFRLRVPVEKALTALVTPRLRDMEELQISDEQLAESSTDTRITVVGGTDYTGVRDYVPGDPMKQIHWKLSAHSREYVTKIQESSRQQEFVVILDFAALPGQDRERRMDLNDCLIETALSLIQEISRHDAGYALLYINRNHGVERAIPAGEDSWLSLLQSFAYITEDENGEFPDACQIIRQESRGANRCANVLTVTSRVTPELIQELQRVRNQRRNPALYAVIPAVWTSREREQFAAPLRLLDEQEIPYYLVPAGEIHGTGQGGTV